MILHPWVQYGSLGRFSAGHLDGDLHRTRRNAEHLADHAPGAFDDIGAGLGLCLIERYLADPVQMKLGIFLRVALPFAASLAGTRLSSAFICSAAALIWSASLLH
jgi:hypothetical protein